MSAPQLPKFPHVVWVDPENWLKTLSQECRAAGLNPEPYHYKPDDLTAMPCSHVIYVICFQLGYRHFKKSLFTNHAILKGQMLLVTRKSSFLLYIFIAIILLQKT